LRTALVTVSSQSYRQGTQLMFYSFLKLHLNFSGDLFLIHDEFNEQDQIEFSQKLGVQCLRLDLELKNKIKQLLDSLPEYKNRQARLYSLQVFNLDYDSVLFVDSDVIFRKNVAELFDLKKPFSACLDWHSQRGGKRNLENFSANSAEKQATFNAGLFHFRPNKLDPNIYEKLLDRISVDQFSKLKSGHTDQLILNQEFSDSINILDSKYNKFILPMSQTEQGQDIDKAAVWHFLRHPKPWKRKAWIKQFLKGRKSSAQVAEWNSLFREFSIRMKYKMSWKEKCLSAIIPLISSRD